MGMGLVTLNRDELQIIRLGLKMLFEISRTNRDTGSAHEVDELLSKIELAIRLLPDKEL